MMGVDPGGLAAAVLAVCAAAIPDSVKLQTKVHDPTWTELARLWVALVGDPSTKKSPSISAAVRPLAEIDEQFFREWSAEMAAFAALPKQEQHMLNPPPQVRAMLGDTTVEAACEVLAVTPAGVLMKLDEFSGWFGAMEHYNSGKGAAADRAVWLQAWNGGPYAVNRISRGAKLIGNLSVSLLGGIQPRADSESRRRLSRRRPVAAAIPDPDAAGGTWSRRAGVGRCRRIPMPS